VGNLEAPVLPKEKAAVEGWHLLFRGRAVEEARMDRNAKRAVLLLFYFLGEDTKRGNHLERPEVCPALGEEGESCTAEVTPKDLLDSTRTCSWLL
jgi:hypothetical protein